MLRTPSAGTLAWLRQFHGAPRSTRWYHALYSPRYTGARIAGDITPAYSTLDERGVPFARRVLRPGCRVMLIVRNPADRVWSALKMRFRARGAAPPPGDVDALVRIAREPIHRLRGDYARMIPLWSDAFGGDFRVFRFDDLALDPAAFLRGVGAFIGAESGVVPARLARRSNSDPEGIAMPPLPRARPACVFRREIERLEALLPGVAAGW